MKNVNIHWFKYQFSKDETLQLNRSSVRDRVKELIEKSESTEMILKLQTLTVGAVMVLIGLVIYSFVIKYDFWFTLLPVFFWFVFSIMRHQEKMEKSEKMSIYREEIYLVYDQQKRLGVAIADLLERMLYL